MRFDQRAFLSGILFLLFFGTAEAQFNQYTPPGGPADRPESRKQEIERVMKEARYHLGAIRIVPLFTVKDVAYERTISELGDTPSDLTATVGAGLRGYLRTGPKLFWRAEAFPQYVWWREVASRRRLNGRYEAGVYGFFNHLTVEADAGAVDEQHIAHPEVLTPVSTRQTFGRLATELRLTGKLSAFATFGVTGQDQLGVGESDPVADELAVLDRDERVLRAGLRWRRGDRLLVGLGVERSRADFDRPTFDRSNEGTSPALELQLDGSRLDIQMDVAARSLQAQEGAAFVPYDKVTGRGAVSYAMGRGLSWSVYGSRDLVYSLEPSYAYLDDERLGMSFQVAAGDTLATRLFVETGTNSYTPFSAATPRRDDDLFSYGGQIRWGLWRFFDLSFHALHTEVDSNLPGFDRGYNTVGVTLGLTRGL
jgi:hypothetical protein